jgi:xanthine dehydrogenase accessory factor
MFDRRIVVRGGGDLGSGAAVRLRRCGFPVAILESARPLAIRRTVSFAEAVYEGHARVEEVAAVRITARDLADWSWGASEVPVLVDPTGQTLATIGPYAVVDAILAKRNTGTTREMAPVVIGLGPGFVAGNDVHAVVETNRGPDLGRVIWSGCSEPNSGVPGPVGGRSAERVLRAPLGGVVRIVRDIGAIVDEGETVCYVDHEPVRAPFRSLVRGLARDGLLVAPGLKIGDLDPRLDPSVCTRVSDKSLAVAGGVLEAVLAKMVKHE